MHDNLTRLFFQKVSAVNVIHNPCAKGGLYLFFFYQCAHFITKVRIMPIFFHSSLKYLVTIASCSEQNVSVM